MPMTAAPSFSFQVLPETFDFKISDSINVDQATIKQPFALICLSDGLSTFSAKSGPASEEDWRCIKLEGTFDFSTSGVLAPISDVFAKASIPVMVFASFHTDYFAVQAKNLDSAVKHLTSAGYPVTMYNEESLSPLCEN